MPVLLGVGRSHKETSLISAFLKLLNSSCSCPAALSTFKKVPVAAWGAFGSKVVLVWSEAQ